MPGEHTECKSMYCTTRLKLVSLASRVWLQCLYVYCVDQHVSKSDKPTVSVSAHFILARVVCKCQSPISVCLYLVLHLQC